ncbi:MAG: HD-GYP domain-containing protein [Candidatus Omnitrophica bacterium]|nr:HD-GYP domain-containing protein [Candidatus Omnitrophota bacterium]
MPKSDSKRLITGSIENASIMRKFTILFLLMSLQPMLVLVYFYWDFKTTGTLKISEASFNVALIFIVCGVTLGYGSMRRVLQSLIDLNKANSKALQRLLTPEKVDELASEQNEITALAQSFKAITDRLEENVRSLELSKKTLHSVMSRVGHGISSMQNIDSFLELILETVIKALFGKSGIILILDRDHSELVMKMAFGEEIDKNAVVRPIKVIEGSKLKEILKIKGPRVFQDPLPEFSSKYYKKFVEGAFICSPLLVKDKVKGMMIVNHSEPNGTFDNDEINLFFNLASQTAVAIENSFLSQDIETTYFETISALALAVDAKDRYSRGHLDRVAKYCVMIAKKIGLDEGDIKTLRDAARLHDLGKIGIPDEVLIKPGPLTDQEWILMKRHPEIGETIIKPITSLRHLCDLVRHHHEKLDGTGYPDGLKAPDISPLVRIMTVADIYDAITTDRPYRGRMTVEQASIELRNMKEQLDQDIVEAFIEALSE